MNKYPLVNVLIVGVPGTGKTQIANAIKGWCMANNKVCNIGERNPGITKELMNKLKVEISIVTTTPEAVKRGTRKNS